MKVSAVVVTYNRKELLLECLQAILNQTYKLDEIIIIDNNSEDGTYEYLKENGILDHDGITYVILNKNTGGAGGFYEGIKRASEKKYDWVWVMDDDTIPKDDCLQKLLEAKDKVKEKVGFMASSVYGENGECMNVPDIDNSKRENIYASWYKYLSNGIVGIKNATFVSILISGEAIQKCGFPIKDYFIWGDDIEYTTRITTYYGKAYFVGESIAIHKRKNSKDGLLLYEEDKKRINLYFYRYRNEFINKRLYEGIAGVTWWYLGRIRETFKILFSKEKFKFRKIIVMHKGIFAAFFKLYDAKAVKNRFN